MVKKPTSHKSLTHRLKEIVMAKKEAYDYKKVVEEVKVMLIDPKKQYACGCLRQDVGVVLTICPEHRCP